MPTFTITATLHDTTERGEGGLGGRSVDVSSGSLGASPEVVQAAAEAAARYLFAEHDWSAAGTDHYQARPARVTMVRSEIDTQPVLDLGGETND